MNDNTLPEKILSALQDGPKSRRELEAETGEPSLTKQLAAMRSLGTVSTVGQRRGLKYVLPEENEA